METKSQIADKPCLYFHEDGVGVKVYREDIPEWANWLAMDKNGAMYAYKDEPKLSEQRGIWYYQAGEQQERVTVHPLADWRECKWIV